MVAEVRDMHQMLAKLTPNPSRPPTTATSCARQAPTHATKTHAAVLVAHRAPRAPRTPQAVPPARARRGAGGATLTWKLLSLSCGARCRSPTSPLKTLSSASDGTDNRLL